MKKYKWGIVSDIIRLLANSNTLGLNGTEQENALFDLSNIMDTMIVQNCGFEHAVRIERENNEDFAEWLKQALEQINIK